jgi:hypothetical protein
VQALFGITKASKINPVKAQFSLFLLINPLSLVISRVFSPISLSLHNYLYMKLVLLLLSILIAAISIIYSSPLLELLTSFTASQLYQTVNITSQSVGTPMSVTSTAKKAMSKLTNAKIVPRRSSDRGHASHGWLNTYHTFSFADDYDPKFQNFGSLRVLNEDRVAAGSGFPTHPHRDAEIFSYILSGELTHRDSMIKKGAEGEQGDKFYRMKRGDVQFTTGGTGKTSHSILYLDFEI